MEGFLRQDWAEPVAVSCQSDASPEATLETLVSLLRGRRVLRRGRRPCEYLLERLLAFDTKGGRTICLARFIDKQSWTHLASAHEEFLHPFAFGCRRANVSHFYVLNASCCSHDRWVHSAPCESVVRRWLQHGCGIVQAAQVVQLVRQYRVL